MTDLPAWWGIVLFALGFLGGYLARDIMGDKS